MTDREEIETIIGTLLAIREVKAHGITDEDINNLGDLALSAIPRKFDKDDKTTHPEKDCPCFIWYNHMGMKLISTNSFSKKLFVDKGVQYWMPIPKGEGK